MRATIKHFLTMVLPYLIIPVAVYSILSYPSSSMPYLAILNKTTIWWMIMFFILFIFFSSNRYFFDKVNKKEMIVISAYLLWMVICIIRGTFAAEIYWDWKGLTYNSMGLLLPLVAYSATNKVIVQSILSAYVKYGLPLFIILMIFIRTDAYGFYLMPVSFLLLFLPALTNRQRLLLLFFSAIVLGADLGARSNVIKFGAPLAILTLYLLKDKISIKLLERARLTLIIAPFIFLMLGITGAFNIFNISDYLGEFKAEGVSNEGDRVELDLSTDTRTFLYTEVIQSAINNDYVLFGRTPARGNDSPSFGPYIYEITGRNERLENEVGVLNVFTWTGAIGVILYMFVFFRASYLAINRSNNIYAKMLGLYVVFRWMYSWVEDVNVFTLNYFVLWLMIGLCFSYSFRMMNDYEVTIWVRGIFDKRYLNFDENLKKEENEK